MNLQEKGDIDIALLLSVVERREAKLSTLYKLYPMRSCERKLRQEDIYFCVILWPSSLQAIHLHCRAH